MTRRKQRERVRCSVRSGNEVRRSKCVNVNGHDQCAVNVYDPTPSLKRQIHAMLFIPNRANLVPRIVTGTGDN